MASRPVPPSRHSLPPPLSPFQYHANIHGADVMQSTNHFLVKTGLMTHMPPVERFAVLFAAAAHDVAHPGTSNRFQIMAKSQGDKNESFTVHVFVACLLCVVCFSPPPPPHLTSII